MAKHSLFNGALEWETYDEDNPKPDGPRVWDFHLSASGGAVVAAIALVGFLLLALIVLWPS